MKINSKKIKEIGRIALSILVGKESEK